MKPQEKSAVDIQVSSKENVAQMAGPTAEEVSGDTILLEVRKQLKSLSSVEECKIVE